MIMCRPQCTGCPAWSTSSLYTLYTPSGPISSAVRWLMTTSHTGVIPASRSDALRATSSFWSPYSLESKFHRCLGRYPSGETECDGGGSQRCVTPAAAMSGTMRVS